MVNSARRRMDMRMSPVPSIMVPAWVYPHPLNPGYVCPHPAPSIPVVLTSFTDECLPWTSWMPTMRSTSDLHSVFMRGSMNTEVPHPLKPYSKH